MPHCDNPACQMLYDACVAEEHADTLAAVADRTGTYRAIQRFYAAHREAKTLRGEAIAAAVKEEKGEAHERRS